MGKRLVSCFFDSQCRTHMASGSKDSAFTMKSFQVIFSVNKLTLASQAYLFSKYVHFDGKCFDAGRATCNVNMSSSLFSDPCPGSSKYLHVKYTCEGLSPSLRY